MVAISYKPCYNIKALNYYDICHGGRRWSMKKGIHPEYVETKVTCACGNTFTVRSNKEELHLETCNKCHPLYTGEQGNKKRTGRVEEFNRKYGFNTETEEK